MGSLKNKLHACEMILNYLESFKSGGFVISFNFREIKNIKKVEADPIVGHSLKSKDLIAGRRAIKKWEIKIIVLKKILLQKIRDRNLLLKKLKRWNLFR